MGVISGACSNYPIPFPADILLSVGAQSGKYVDVLGPIETFWGRSGCYITKPSDEE